MAYKLLFLAYRNGGSRGGKRKEDKVCSIAVGSWTYSTGPVIQFHTASSPKTHCEKENIIYDIHSALCTEYNLKCFLLPLKVLFCYIFLSLFSRSVSLSGCYLSCQFGCSAVTVLCNVKKPSFSQIDILLPYESKAKKHTYLPTLYSRYSTYY